MLKKTNLMPTAKEKRGRPGMMVHTPVIPGTWKVEAGGSGVRGQMGQS
jgi:hypothetical protein